ncbi:MAG: methionyl-tRNA formyltransferase [Candidatus Magasanikbacteria bacterium]
MDKFNNFHNYIFFGTPKFAEIILEKLIENNLSPRVIVCNPDRPAGRSQELKPPATKKIAQEYDIKTYQPENLTLEGLKQNIPENVKIALLAAYGQIVSRDIIEYFPEGIIGIHPSLLPKYRGPTPIRTPLLEGENKTGTTLFLMDEKLDHGPIISQKKIRIEPRETYKSLHNKLAKLSAELIIETLPKYLAGKVKPKAQNHKSATKTSFFNTDDGKVEFDDLVTALNGNKKLSKEIDRKIRSLNPRPGVWTKTKDREVLNLPKHKRVKLLESHLEEDKLVLDKIHVAGKPEPREP